MSASNLGENKWKKILSLAQALPVADLAGADQSQLSGVAENEEYLFAARAQIPVLDSENEDASIGENSEDEDRDIEKATDEEGGVKEANNGEER